MREDGFATDAKIQIRRGQRAQPGDGFFSADGAQAFECRLTQARRKTAIGSDVEQARNELAELPVSGQASCLLAHADVRTVEQGSNRL
jgi:hypothetical protein